MRLHAQEPANIEQNFQNDFVMPTEVATWRQYLTAGATAHTRHYNIQHKLQGNLAHRFQILEFETALLLHYKERLQAVPQGFTLHTVVASLKIHQHAVLCHAILEGLASHLRRALVISNNKSVSLTKQIRPHEWRPALLATCFPNLQGNQRQSLDGRLKDLTEWRNRIHMDTVRPTQALHYNEFTISNRFEPTYRLFQEVMTAFNANFPTGTCLNETI